MKTHIHVSQPNIRYNIKNPDNRKKVLTAKSYQDNIYCDVVIFKDDEGKEVARLVYSPDKPLSCGARVFIVADSKNVETVGGEEYESK